MITLPLVSKIFSTTKSKSTYEAVNDIIGQIKDYLMTFAGVSLVSDNIGNSSTLRIVQLKFGNNPHIIEIKGLNYNQSEINILSLNGSVLFTSAAYINLQNSSPPFIVPLSIFYTQNNIVVCSDNLSYALLALIKATPTDLVGHHTTKYNPYDIYFVADDDTPFRFSYTAGNTADGKKLLRKGYLQNTAGYISSLLTPSLLVLGGISLTSGVYKDENNAIYFVINNVVFKE